MRAAFCLQSSYSDNERYPWQPVSEAGSVKVLMADVGDCGGRPARRTMLDELASLS